MAICALLSQGCVVLIVLLVTADTSFCCLLEHRTLVAILAIGFDMLAKQRKTALVMVKLGGLFPATFTVATCAIFTECFFVLVVFAMTGITILTQFDPIKIACVTRDAGRREMFAAQNILGVRIVIKSRELPLFDIVASLTFPTKLTLVPLGSIVIFLMATDTSTRRFLVVASLMTASALGIYVLAL